MTVTPSLRRKNTKLGYFLSSEEHPAKTLLDQAMAAEEARFESIFISDHFHAGREPICLVGNWRNRGSHQS
jgi:alkanesulfonate monooxygenase SsuD/methylene tetrahydromethanopterin reductase-like flavin-dependent oxidoreductase (luciferase family)